MTIEAQREGLLAHLAADNGDEPREFCDRHGGYVDEGRTQPYATGSPFRICDGCLDESRRRLSLTCAKGCGYAIGAHPNGRCPTSEAEAVETWGTS